MKRIILTYGLISGAIVGALLLASAPLWNAGILNYDNGEYVGYTTMVIALSLIFFAIRSFRDQYNNGTITFGKGVQIGLLITLIAGVMYALAWEISYNVIMSSDFIAGISQHYIDSAKSKGATAAELEELQSQIVMMTEWYKNPFLRFAMTLTEILPVGIGITLLSAGLLRRKNASQTVEETPA